MRSFRQTTTRPDRGFRRPLALGLLLSVLAHVVVALAWRGPVLAPPDPSSEERPAEARRTAAGGALRAVALREPDQTEELRRPEPVELSSAPDVQSPRPAEPSLSTGALERPGTGPPGEGNREDSRTVHPPVPRSVLPEWDAPESVRGRSVTVRVHVDSAGAPTGAVELVPATPSQSFNRRLIQKVRAMRFSPARDGRGRRVAAWAELTFSF